MHTTCPPRTETVHSRTHAFRYEGQLDEQPRLSSSIMVTDHPDGLEFVTRQGLEQKVTLLTWDMLFDHCHQAGEEIVQYECLNCGADYGDSLMSDYDPTDSCDQHSTAEGEGLIVPKGAETIRVWIWANVHYEYKVLGFRWFFRQEAAEEFIASTDAAALIAHTLEEVEINLKQDDFHITTKADLELAIDRYWLDHPEDFLLRMVTGPQ